MPSSCEIGYFSIGLEIRGQGRPINWRTELLYRNPEGKIDKEKSMVHIMDPSRNQIVLAEDVYPALLAIDGIGGALKTPMGYLRHPLILEYRLTDVLGFSTSLASMREKETADGYLESFHLRGFKGEGRLLQVGFRELEYQEFPIARRGENILLVTMLKLPRIG